MSTAISFYVLHTYNKNIKRKEVAHYMSQLLNIIGQILSHTPIWVWVILIVLIKRGMALQTDSPVSLAKSFIMPTIFILWGLDTIVTKFHHPLYLLMAYLLCLCLGACVSLYIYRNKRFYIQNTILMQSGSKIPLIIMISNFCIKYCLNVLLSTQPSLYSVFGFNLIYGVISGFTVGLFFGGIIQSFRAKSRLLA
ncbi:membrane protein [Lactococcus plantarum]|uniref:Membrane protein n=2 Tax=Pseudolactococcus plantarum TaxID=1365 RepID=A0A2A5RZ53_9LACT|nr:membrane protein [Lactococcus plantarum]